MYHLLATDTMIFYLNSYFTNFAYYKVSHLSYHTLFFILNAFFLNIYQSDSFVRRYIIPLINFYNFFFIFHPTVRTGRTCVPKPTCKSRKDTEGQRGIISCLKFNPDYSGAYAAGTYAHNITIYAENVQNSVLELEGLEFGVTCLRWSPCGNMLWAGNY